MTARFTLGEAAWTAGAQIASGSPSLALQDGQLLGGGPRWRGIALFEPGDEGLVVRALAQRIEVGVLGHVQMITVAFVNGHIQKLDGLLGIRVC